MPLINLIQEQRDAALREERKARVCFFSFVGSAVAVGAGLVTLLIQNESLKSQEANLRAQIQKIEPIISEIEKNQKQYEALAPRLTTLADAQALSNKWGRILTHLTTQTPDRVWLTVMRASDADPEKPVEVSLVGLGAQQEPVAEFMMRLQNAPDLEAVALRYTQEKTLQNGRATEFEIVAGVEGTAQKKPTEEKKS